MLSWRFRFSCDFWSVNWGHIELLDKYIRKQMFLLIYNYHIIMLTKCETYQSFAVKDLSIPQNKSKCRLYIIFALKYYLMTCINKKLKYQIQIKCSSDTFR